MDSVTGSGVPRRSRRYDPGSDYVDFDVVASNGRVGTVDPASYTVAAEHLVVRTGLRTLWRKVLLPSTAIERVDPASRTVHLRLRRAEVRDAPDFDEAAYRASRPSAEAGE